jgi:RNA-binding protein
MLTKDQKKYLRTLLHGRGVIIWIGQNGLTPNVLTEIEAALDHHELIKMKIRAGDNRERDRLTLEICERTRAEKIQKTGHVVCLYRANRAKPVIRFPK